MMYLQGQQFGRYRIVSLLGSGGMGEVYLAEDERIEQQVALKVIKAEISLTAPDQADQEAARLFQREVRAIARLDHPHILPLFDYGEQALGNMTLLYLVMPYRREGSLADWLRQQKQPAVSPQQAAYWLEQAADALQHAHEHQVIHQDVKLSNFLLRERKGSLPDLLLSDFGIARLTSVTSSASQAIRGTPLSMSPEQWQGKAVPATDQYALAVMAYQLLAGRPPFTGALGPLMFQHLNSPPPPLSSLDARFSAAVDVVLLRALAKQSEERFPTITLFAAALRQALAALLSPSQAASPLSPPQELQIMLALTPAEAQRGTARTLTLPGGDQFRVDIPAGVRDGQRVRLPGQGPERTDTTLLLTIRVLAAEPTVLDDPIQVHPTRNVTPPQSPVVLKADPQPSGSASSAQAPTALAASAEATDDRSTTPGADFSPTTPPLPDQSTRITPEAHRTSLKPAPFNPPAPVSPSPPSRARRTPLRTPASIVILVTLIVLLLSGGSVGIYSMVTGHLPWNTSSSGSSGGSYRPSSCASGWCLVSTTSDRDFTSVAWSGSLFVTVTEGAIFTSSDGMNWAGFRPSSLLSSTYLNDVAWSGSQFIAVGEKGTVLTSPDGDSWTSHAPPASVSSQDLNSVTWSGSQFIAVGEKGTILTSPDGRTWTAHPLPSSISSEGLNGVAWSGSRFVAVGGFLRGTILTSPDGRTWTAEQIPTSHATSTLVSVAWSGSQFIVVGMLHGGKGTILTSPDGRTWTAHPLPASDYLNSLQDVTCSKTQCMAVGDNGTVLTSSDGVTWKVPAGLANLPSHVIYNFRGVARSGAHFIIVGDSGMMLLSP